MERLFKALIVVVTDLKTEMQAEQDKFNIEMKAKQNKLKTKIKDGLQDGIKKSKTRQAQLAT